MQICINDNPKRDFSPFFYVSAILRNVVCKRSADERKIGLNKNHAAEDEEFDFLRQKSCLVERERWSDSYSHSPP